MTCDDNAIECGSLRARLQQRGGNVLHEIRSVDAPQIFAYFATARCQRAPSVGYAGLTWVDELPAQSIHPTLLGAVPYQDSKLPAQSIHPTLMAAVPYVTMNMPAPASTVGAGVSAESSQAQLSMGNPFQALQNVMAPCLATPQTHSVAARSSQRSASLRIVNKKIDRESEFEPSAPKASQVPVAPQTQASGESAEGRKGRWRKQEPQAAPAVRLASQQAVTSQTHAAGESAGQMLLRMVQGPNDGQILLRMLQGGRSQPGKGRGECEVSPPEASTKFVDGGLRDSPRSPIPELVSPLGPKTHALHGTCRSPSWADACDSDSDCSTADTMDSFF